MATQVTTSHTSILPFIASLDNAVAAFLEWTHPSLLAKENAMDRQWNDFFEESGDHYDCDKKRFEVQILRTAQVAGHLRRGYLPISEACLASSRERSMARWCSEDLW